MIKKLLWMYSIMVNSSHKGKGKKYFDNKNSEIVTFWNMYISESNSPPELHRIKNFP